MLSWGSTQMTVLTKIEGVASLDASLPLWLAPETNVRTPCGPRRVENLRPGDLIVTRRDGLQPLRMIWKRTIAASEIAADPSLAPVAMKPRAVGPMMPQTELRLAGSHKLLVPGYRLEGLEDTDACLVRARWSTPPTTYGSTEQIATSRISTLCLTAIRFLRPTAFRLKAFCPARHRCAAWKTPCAKNLGGFCPIWVPTAPTIRCRCIRSGITRCTYRRRPTLAHLSLQARPWWRAFSFAQAIGRCGGHDLGAQARRRAGDGRRQ